MKTKLLFVDMDDTVVRTDSLGESLFVLLRRDRSAFFASLRRLLAGKAAFKRRVADATVIDPSTLPYDERVLAFLRERRAAGQTVVLATAAERRPAEAVAAHLGLFDAVLATDDGRNNGGPAKLEGIRTYAAGRPFEFLGDADEQDALWRAATVGHVVGDASLVSHVARLTEAGRTFLRPRLSLRLAADALRVRQWMKNLLVFVPSVLAHRADEPAVLVRTVVAFAAFSLVASAAYAFNDLWDLEVDRSHPTKRRRPLASGDLRIIDGLVLAAVSFAAALALSAVLSPRFLAVIVGYFVLTSLYTSRLKRSRTIDVIVIATCFASRLFAGGIATGIPLSGWLLAFSAFFFLSIALLKRYAEIAMFSAAGASGIVPGRGYALTDAVSTRRFGVAAAAVALAVMALYVTSPVVTVLYRSPGALWLVVAATGIWIGRLWLLASRGAIKDDPFAFATADGTSYATALVMAVTLMLAAA